MTAAIIIVINQVSSILMSRGEKIELKVSTSNKLEAN